MVAAGFVGLLIGATIVGFSDFSVGLLIGYAFAWVAIRVAVGRVFEKYRGAGW